MNNKKNTCRIMLWSLITLFVAAFVAAPTPDPGHPAGEIGSGLFAGGGDYRFPSASKVGIGVAPTSNLTISRGSLCVTSGSSACSTAAAGNVEVEDGSLCVGDLGCTPSSTQGQVFAEGACLSASVLYPCTSPIPLGNMEIEDGSLCIGDNGCSSAAGEGNLFVSKNVTINDGSLCVGRDGCSGVLEDGELSVDNGLCVGSASTICSGISDGDIEVENGAICIGQSGCDASSLGNGQLVADGGLCVDSGGSYCSSPSWGDVEIEDGAVCIGDSGCTPPTSHGLLIVERGVCIGSPSVSCSDPASGGLEIEDGSVCIGNDGCDATTNDGELRIQKDVEIEDGSLCVGDGGCGAPTTDAQIHINSTGSVTSSSTNAPLLIGPATSGARLMLDRDGIFTNTGEDMNIDPGGDLVIGTSISDTNIELEDGAMCIGSSGCTAPLGDGSLSVEEGIIAEASSGLVGAVYGRNSETGSYAYIGLGYDGVIAYPGTGGYAGVFNGNLLVTGTCSGSSSCNEDVAEYMKSENVEAGDVVEISPAGFLTRAKGAYRSQVVGIISTNPSLILPSGEDVKNDPSVKPLALTGLVPVKVTSENGVIRAGDLLVSSSTPGHAMRCDDRKKCYGAVIGKSLEPFDEKKGVINAIVMLG